MNQTLHKIITMFVIVFTLLGLTTASFQKARARMGTYGVTAGLYSAQAMVEDDDDILPWYEDQDFYFKFQTNSGTVQTSQTWDDRDYIGGNPLWQTNTTVPRTRIIPVHAELWDSDPVSSDDHFDINSTAGAYDVNFNFDTCTFAVYSTDGTFHTQTPGPWLLPAGNEGDRGQVQINISTADGKPFSTNDVAIADVTPVQAVYHPTSIISGKATAFRVKFTSSWTVDKHAVVSVTMNDHLNPPVTDTKDVIVPPDGLTVFFFDGSGVQPPFYPGKSSTNATLEYHVNAAVDGESSALDEPGFEQCHTGNNTAFDSSLVVRSSKPLSVIYAPFDWLAPGTAFIPSMLPDSSHVAATMANNETFRRAIFPTDTITSAVSPVPIISPFWASMLLEPWSTLAIYDVAARMLMIDRLVLMPKAGWFELNQTHGNLIPGAWNNKIGVSAVTLFPRAVIAETDYSQTAVHELGHTFGLSQHPCSTSSWIERLIGIDCVDEYTHAASDGAPYPGLGYDVQGFVYPTGKNGLSGTRDVNAPNFMYSSGQTGNHYDLWIDSLSYTYLAKQVAPYDPTVINVTGTIKILPSLDAPESFEVTLMPSFKFDGDSDFAETKAGTSAGSGIFQAVLVTPWGDHTYKFNASFGAEGSVSDVGFFSMSIPWDPTATELQIWGPSSFDTNSYKPVELTSSTFSTYEPSFVAVAAAPAAIPDPANPPAQPPVIPIGQDVGIGWSLDDKDTSTKSLSVNVMLLAPGSKQYMPSAMYVNADGIVLPYQTFQKKPGDYGARFYVTDGVNTTTYDVPILFTIQSVKKNYSIYLPVTIK